MPDELERLQINIEADASGTVAGAAQAKQAMAGMRQSVKQATDGIKHDMRDVAASVKGVASAAAKAAKLGNLELIHEAQIAHAEALRSKIKLLNAEVSKAMRKSGGDAMSKAVIAAQEKLAKTQLQFAKAAADVDKTAAKIWAADDAAANASAVNETATATGRLKANAAGAAARVREVRKEIEKVGRKGPTLLNSIGRSLRSMLVVTVVARGVQRMTRWMGSLVAADRQVAASLAAVRGNMMTAFAPIYSTAIPALRDLIGWLASATSWVATFVSALFGMSGGEAQEIAKSLDGIGGSAGGASDQMKELLGSFDELNKLDRTQSGGGGGGGGNIDFSQLTKPESAVNAAEKVSEFWGAWGDWIEAGAFAGGISWLLSKLSGLLDTIRNSGTPLSTLLGKLNSLGGSAKTLGDNLDKVNQNATVTFSASGDEVVSAKIDKLSKEADALSRKPAVVSLKARDMLTQKLSRIRQLLNDISGRNIDIQASADTTSAVLKITTLKALTELIPSEMNVGVNVDAAGALANLAGIALVAKLIPASMSIGITANTKNALNNIEELKKSLANIPNRIKVNVEVETKEITSNSGDTERTGGGGSTRGGGGGRASTSGLSKLASATIDISKLRNFATGGLNISRGQLFVANESGAEMVGHIGGKTAVANQQEISGAIWREMQQYRSSSSGASADDIADAVARALNGVAVKVGERQVGQIVVHAVNKGTRQAGRVDFAF